MNIQQALRPVDTKRNKNLVFSTEKEPGVFTWVHLDKGGQPFCGEEYDMERYNFRIEQIDLDDPEAINEFGGSHVCRRCAAAFYQYKVETHQSGQARSYQDSWYIYQVVDTAEEKRDREKVLSFCQRFIKHSYSRDELPGWSHPELRGFTETRPGSWSYRVRMAYTG